LLLRPAGDRVLRFLGGRGPDLALSVLRLAQVIGTLPTDTTSRPQLHLAADLPLGRALVALAGLTNGATVAVDGAAGGTYAATKLQQRILADLEAVSAAHAPPGSR